MNSQNRWAQFANVLLGRPDNSIKNYWNCTFRHKQTEMRAKFDDYMNYCLRTDRPKDRETARNGITQRLLKYFIQQSHGIYMDYLKSRRCELIVEGQLTRAAPDNKVRSFNLRLLEETLTLSKHLMQDGGAKPVPTSHHSATSQ